MESGGYHQSCGSNQLAMGPTNGAIIIQALRDPPMRGGRAPSACIADSTTYYPDEQTVCQCPCFDLSQLKRPMISFDLLGRHSKRFDGTVLQYS